jgi:hypothetical protein
MTQERTGTWTGSPAGRVDRPLGRGLEEVSHVFLSKKVAEGTPADAPDRSAERLPHGAGSRRAGILPLRSYASLTRQDLAAMLPDVEGTLEQGLHAIDRDIPCHPLDEIDLLAVDRTNQLVIVDFDIASNDGLLLRGLGHLDWIVHNIAGLRRMYPGLAINFSALPRIFLLAPQFSAGVHGAARHLSRPQIVWIRYLVVEAGTQTGILFERFAAE